MIETLAYFIRYLIPLSLSAGSVCVLTLFNQCIGPLIWRGKIADPMEVLAYSVRTAGPFAFAITFIIFFFGLEVMKEDWGFAKASLIIAIILAVIGLAADIIFIPRVR
jgi:hypothetical protein